MPISRRQTPAIIFAIIAAIAVVGAIWLISKLKTRNKENQKAATEAIEKPQPDHGADSISLIVNGKHVDETDNNHAESPEELVGRISEIMLQANDSGDLQPFINFVGPANLTPPQINRLRQRAEESRLKLKADQPFSTIEGQNDQWTLNLADEKNITLNLHQKTNGLWTIKGLILPSLTEAKKSKIAPSQANSDAIADQKAISTDQVAATVQKFITAIIDLDPASAGSFIDQNKVSYATLAGLCILFEEGHYQLVKEEAVRNMFLSDNAAGWIVRVENPDAEKTALIALSSKRISSDWKITEINLDKLLANYATQLIGGDVHYMPLIKNPKGGDSIVLYFHLNSKELTLRTQRQLEIIANLLKSAPAKKLTISGHTDATGSDDYNLNLSNLRAKQTMSYLASQGVNPDQMEVISFGKAKPRQPNTTKDGRRANRRTEILLDF